MTRIIAGTAGGRSIRTPSGRDTRPTTDRVREALFSRVESLMVLDGARVLDLFAGSGALGLEALSRGASHLLAVERHRPTARLVQTNAATLGLGDQVQVVAAPVEAVLSRSGPGRSPAEPGESDRPYDLVLLDPPYPLAEADLGQVLAALVEHGWLTPESLVVVERSARSPEPNWPTGLARVDTRTYGETAVHVAEVPEAGAGSPGD